MEKEKFSRKNFNEVLEYVLINTLSEGSLRLLTEKVEKKVKIALIITKGILNILLKFNSGIVIRDKGKIAGVCLLIPPGKEIKNTDLISHGFLKLPLITGINGFIVLLRILDVSSKLYHDFMKNHDHWNLFHFSWDRNKPNAFKELSREFKELIEGSGLPVFSQTFQEDIENSLQKIGFKSVAGIEFNDDFILKGLIKQGY